MRCHEIESAIGEALAGTPAHDYWNGMVSDYRAEAVGHAQEHGIEATVELVTNLAEPPDYEPEETETMKATTINRYNRVVVSQNRSCWSWTGGSVTRCDIERDGEVVSRGKMIAQTARVLDWHEKIVGTRRSKVDEIRRAGAECYWIIDQRGQIRMACRADKIPASWRYAATLARRRRSHRMRSGEALVAACRALREEETVHQDLHDVMYALLGLPPIHCPTCAEMWPKTYAATE